MANSLSSLMDENYYLVWPDGAPVHLSALGEPGEARTIRQVAFWATYQSAKRYVDSFSDYGLRILRIRIARSEEGMPFLYSEVASDIQSAPPAIGVKIQPAKPFSTWGDLPHLYLEKQ